MNTKKIIQKVLLVAMWILVGAGMISLLAATLRYQKNEKCSGYEIEINGASKNLFVDENDVLKILTGGTDGKIKGKKINQFDLQKLEQAIRKNVWVKDAQLFFDSKAALNVHIMEREPIARFFTESNHSFYWDKEAVRLPLSDKLTANVPVFTGFPDKGLQNDSVLTAGIKTIAEYLNADTFWLKQVQQIDILPDGSLILVPLVGNSVVKLGKANDIERKLNRLYVFYREVLSRTGFNKYRAIDVQYAGQVIGIKGGMDSVDSLQYQRSVEMLLTQARQVENDSLNIAPAISKPGAEAAVINSALSDSLSQVKDN